jgi:ABC-2 type transport system permease protein
MRSSSQNTPPAKLNFAQPGAARIRVLNLQGLSTLYLKEIRRFWKVQMQTVWAPAVTTLLFLAVFTVALGRAGRIELGVPFADFLAPGLIIMGMIQNAFANSSSSLIVAKVQGTIIDLLMPPLTSLELMIAFVAGAVTRAILVGLAVWIAMTLWPGVHVAPKLVWPILYFGIMGAMLLGLLGVLTGIWAEKFDHGATVSNFIVQPLALLSGTFYTVDRLPGIWQAISHANPFFFIIDGFRYGFLGVADGPILLGALVLLGLNIVLGGICYALLQSGWKLKA